jgi:diguanylate cyclase (GGDEF)-like protein/PAS domain S-box-containing protein
MGPRRDEPTADAAADLLARVREALRHSEARFQGLLDLSSDWYWEQDAQLRFSFFSDASGEKSGVSEQALLGKTRWDTPALNLDAQDWARHRRMLERHEPFDDFLICRPDAQGRPHWVSVSGRPVFERGEFLGYRGTAKDVTPLREREEALLRFRAAVDATADGIHIVDFETMRFIDVNETACRYLGYSRAEFLAMTISNIAPQADTEALKRLYDRLFTGEDSEQSAEIVHRHRDGRTIPIEIRRRGTLINGRRIVVNVVRDITANKKTEQTIRHHALQQGLIAAFGHQALAGSELDELIARAVDAAGEGLGVSFCALMQTVPHGKALVLQAGSGWAPGWIGRVVSEDGDESHARYALATGQSVEVEDFAHDKRFIASGLVAAHALRSGIDVPVIGAQGPYGVLGTYSGELRRFTPENINFLQSLANILATAMDRRATDLRLTYMAQFDALTGLPNRSLFLDRFAQTLTQAQRNGWLIGAVFVDLDRFKVVNDTLGHSCGDQLLVQVAERLGQCVRSGDTVGRLSGDEFALVLSSLARADDAALVAQKAVAALAEPFHLQGQDVYVTASLGIAVYPTDGADPDALLKNADTAMYRAKERGRNGYQFYLPQMNERAAERLRLDAQLRGALERGEFVLHYQPKASLASGEICGFEALLRWQHPQRGLVPPLEFISVLEETGLIVPVGEWVVRTVCEQLVRWRGQGVPLRPVAVNLSARQFQQRDLDATLAAIVRDTGVEARLLEFELTESMLMHDPAEAARMLAGMKATGVRFSIDDFGTGFSSLAHLKRFRLDALKIDQAFIRDVTTDPDDASIALTIINLARSLKLTVVAEGVETEAQLAFLEAHGCDEIQGYFFARPMTADDCTQALLENRRLRTR